VCATGRLQAIPLQVFQDQINVNFLGAVAITQGEAPLRLYAIELSCLLQIQAEKCRACGQHMTVNSACLFLHVVICSHRRPVDIRCGCPVLLRSRPRRLHAKQFAFSACVPAATGAAWHSSSIADASTYSYAGFVPALEAAAKRGAKPVVAMVNSFAGRIPLRSMPAYTASKYALAGFTDAIRPELADVGIHVAQIGRIIRSRTSWSCPRAARTWSTATCCAASSAARSSRRAGPRSARVTRLRSGCSDVGRAEAGT